MKLALFLGCNVTARVPQYESASRAVLEALAEFSARTREPDALTELVRQRLELYERELARVEPHIDGHYLRSLGVPPGPIYGEILSRVRDALLDGQVRTPEEEEALAKRLVEAAHKGERG